MKNLLNAIGYLTVVFGGLIVMIGALYKIESWSPPVVAGGELNLLLLGMLLAGGGIFLVIAAKLIKAEERMELDPNRIPRSAEKVEELLGDDDQYV